jgi:DNA-directed RNA polymerase specialized sigma24 family protein
MSTVSDVPMNPSETPEQMLARLMRCPKLHATVKKIARNHGVRPAEIEDVLQETLLAASTNKNLPRDEGEARKVIHGTAKHKALDWIAMKKEQEATSLDAMGGKGPRVGQRLEQRSAMQALFERGAAKFGKKWDWFLAAKVDGQTSKEIGAAHGVTDSHVRDELSVVDRWVAAAWSKQGVGGALALLVAIGAGWWLTHRGPVDDSQWPTYHPSYANVVKDDRTVLDAEGLRDRARFACLDGAWNACEHDLTAARLMDPAGQTPDLDELEATARDRMTLYEQGHEQLLNAKPPR